MNPLDKDELILFLRNNIEPLENMVYGREYRASIYLIDGTSLPCVSFRNSKNIVELASRRFREEELGKGVFKEKTNAYEEIIKSFVAKRNCVNDYLIAKVEKSKNAFPISILKEIQGETTMSWTGFAAKMKDGKYVGFGTQFSTEFF